MVQLGAICWEEKAFSKEELSRLEKMFAKLELLDVTTKYENYLEETERVVFLGVDENQEEDEEQHRHVWAKHAPQSEEWEWLYDKLGKLIVEANNELWDFDLTHMRELIQYSEYRPGDEFDWHMDCSTGNPVANQRKVSLSVQLSDPSEYEGGTLEFIWKGMVREIPKTKGGVIIFPSYMLHRVTPITKGVRRSLILQAGGEPFR